jgi:Tfp pilus assembly PilM family ATPase
VPASLSNPRARRLEPPLRRVLAVDAGSRCIRLLLLESYFGRLRVLRQDALDLQEEGLVAPEELKAHLQKTLSEWGRPPLALVVPQQVAVTQLVELPPVSETEARQLIEAETIKLGGLNESAMVYDFVRVETGLSGRHSFWVTFCQEGEVQSRIAQLGLDQQEFREITTVANALLTAWQAARPGPRDVVLVHAGAQSTTLVGVRRGVGVFAASFPMAGDFFTRGLARLQKCPAEAAEALKRSTNVLTGDRAVRGFAEIVDGWAAELKRQLADWNAAANGGTALPVLIATGGAFEQPGLLEYLAAGAGLKFERWPLDRAADALQPAMGFEIALGLALQALGAGTQPVSLLPAPRRAAWQRRLGRQRLEFANALLLGALAVALVFGLWQKFTMIRHKQALLDKVQAGLESVQANQALTAELLGGYDSLRPLFERQQATVDTLQAFALLQTARSNRPLWFVLLADQQSYFALPPTRAGTNKPAPAAPVEGEFVRRPEATNPPPAHPGLIAELCVPEDADAARATISLVVGSLKKSPAFARVDLLSEDLRRSMADPKVLIPDRHFALALDFATTEFQSAARRPRPLLPPRPAARPPAAPRPSAGETVNQTPPP